MASLEPCLLFGVFASVDAFLALKRRLLAAGLIEDISEMDVPSVDKSAVAVLAADMTSSDVPAVVGTKVVAPSEMTSVDVPERGGITSVVNARVRKVED